ncbi:MAG: histidine triad nucleotide-binding protein [Acidobacteria bacterium]|nr:histidine triad nucleotide-binding protein [Acidobacteriota bacterium]
MSKDCLFCRILNKEVPAKIVYEDDRAIAFEDINPQAPTHILVVSRRHIAGLNDVGPEDAALLGHLQLVAAQLARDRRIAESGYRTVLNTGRGAGQSIFHIHLHLLGGRGMRWPPG